MKISLRIFLLFFLVAISIDSYAVTAPQKGGAKKESIQHTRKSSAKKKRLKKLLTKLEAKQKKLEAKQKTITPDPEESKIKNLSGTAIFLGILALLFTIGLGLGVIGGLSLSLFSIPFGILTYVFAGRTFNKIKKSDHPEKYDKQKKQAQSARFLAVLWTFLIMAISMVAAVLVDHLGL